jgi:hypothetical protein
MANYVKVMLLMLLVSSRALAGFTDFEDLQDGSVFTIDDTINSKGLSFQPISNTVRIRDSSMTIGNAGGSGLELRIGSSMSELSFLLPVGVQHVSMKFGAYDPAAAIVVNGVASALSGDFDSLNGSILGGVRVSVMPSPMPPGGLLNQQGTLTLTGAINSLVVRGPELSIDNVQVTIPEPSSALMYVGICVSSLASAFRPMRVKAATIDGRNLD